MGKMKPIIMSVLMIFLLAACQQEEVVYEPIKKTGKENIEQAVEETKEEASEETNEEASEVEEENPEQESGEMEEEVSQENFEIRIITTTLNVRSEPEPDAPIIRSVQRNEQFTVEAVEQDGDGEYWYRIRLSETNSVGYIISEFAERIE